jgi:N-acetylmuramoyl-L-alanine amidase
LIIICLFVIIIGGSKAVAVLSESASISGRKTVVVDAGHGGVDGGATSCTGVLESQFNLEIAQKLNDLLNLLGINTVMIRNTDCSVYTEGETIAQKKVSDLKERVRIVNSTDNCILVSIHQNLFSDGKYSGAQVFYAPTEGSQMIAKSMQASFIKTLNPHSHRQEKKADSIYLMQHINCPGVLVECGFLSNPQEEYLLRTKDYQQKVCCVIACTISNYLYSS